ncbi:hypothetical protein AUEXF2481DRAFT_2582 [Aureobasidium subglaciale EXF-2481]|uniref:Uncharacterized protein n=1 Tax=Aureobasidium subglaciale (strain EXF-2481) TaxID=1043005 RepID=A0A074YNH7_AURSE|nr:uncharacterized protein AUEXF2481DRAFT_2582 [Aureobasidium subglaciale EXF-2481]KAI5195048.1 hypothetical protein E4T38_09265 [Aureobasidium subglaciale]KAI5214145.1 hypothetical protein E4T40_09216 [Aureobasidium subglaciale]KAI5216583.1 hypothetical protein E4T41_09217 [Aureobasidium subglaciale]KAI5254462.1 hypothetical protein E4T46_09172 [Aureobasidium subglaciale]KEQ97644.1 hypothetical protein AUEXF2481DRAFT_2582 [Aureobasidium subglaciale EXF-2481]
MSLEFLQRPNSDAASAPIASAPESQVNTSTAPTPVPEPIPATAIEEPVTVQESTPSQETTIASEEPAPTAPATMSYASVAASGPQQSEEERLLTRPQKRAHAVPEIQHTDDEVHELIDVDSPHISSVPSDFQSQEIQTETQAERERLESEAREKAQQTEQVKEEVKEKTKQKAEKAAEKVKANSDNPVILGNTIAVVALGSLLGFGAYRKYSAGQLTWKVAGAWAGVVGVFGLGDYYASKYLFKKYPPKN